MDIAGCVGTGYAWQGGYKVTHGLVAELQPTLILLDTQARITVGMEENAAKDMGEFVDKLERLRRASGACVLIVHHMGRNGEHMRGSTALEGAATTILQASKEDNEITVSCEKQRTPPSSRTSTCASSRPATRPH